MPYLSYAAIERTPLEKDPFEYVIIPNCVNADGLKQIITDFPAVPGAGSQSHAVLPAAKVLRTKSRPVPTTRRRESALGQDLTSAPQVRDISSTTVSGLAASCGASPASTMPS